jgi:hypothetical protein
MTKTERAELLKMVVGKLDEAAETLRAGEEELLSDQVTELADLIDSLIPESEPDVISERSAAI